MDLLTLIVTLAVIGFACWIVVTYVPMPEPIKRALVVIVVLVVLIWLVRALALGTVIPIR